MEQLTWAQFKKYLDHGFKFMYEEATERYFMFTKSCGEKLECVIQKVSPASSDQTDFETNYKSDATSDITDLLPPLDPDHRMLVVSASRPLNCTTYFTMAGDSSTVVGAGQELKWDFGNTDDDVSSPPTGFKQKRIEFDFKDSVWIKEGTIYWKDAPFGSYIEIKIVNKSPEIVVSKYVNKHFMMDSCVIGDELNTEQASQELGTSLKFWLEITVPDVTGYDNFKGYAELELYRENTV